MFLTYLRFTNTQLIFLCHNTPNINKKDVQSALYDRKLTKGPKVLTIGTIKTIFSNNRG